MYKNIYLCQLVKKWLYHGFLLTCTYIMYKAFESRYFEAFQIVFCYNIFNWNYYSVFMSHCYNVRRMLVPSISSFISIDIGITLRVSYDARELNKDKHNMSLCLPVILSSVHQLASLTVCTCRFSRSCWRSWPGRGWQCRRWLSPRKDRRTNSSE